MAIGSKASEERQKEQQLEYDIHVQKEGTKQALQELSSNEKQEQIDLLKNKLKELEEK